MPKTGVLSYLLAFFLDTEFKNVHGCTFLSDGTDVRGTPQKRMYFTLP